MTITQTRTPASSNRSSGTGVHGRGHSTDKLTFRFGLRTPETGSTSRTSNSASNRRG
ncbi:hypothetical protein [Plantibacter sp. ME-Dv--P-095]|uniref:hypothetical protein n=1 Tax=Plantibacter sp. ME-Dv--P-095 TaxID=3040299 RepID=UPI00254DFCCB|nr:hypothetical protein [Plantibacter sp. ME-Dv--P-095]